MLLTPRKVSNFEASPPKHQKQVCNCHSFRNGAVNHPRHAPNWVSCAQAGMILDPQLGGALALPERAIARSYGPPETGAPVGSVNATSSTQNVPACGACNMSTMLPVSFTVPWVV
jgi:hypothetical protein